MAFDKQTQSYPDYPRSKFPGNICNAPNMIDVTAALRKSAEEYERAWSENNIEKMRSLLSSNPDLAKTLFNSDKFNTLLDEVKATQRYYKENVEGNVQELIQHAIGIKDNASSDEEKKVNAYSAYKTEYLTGKIIANNISIPISRWTDDSTSGEDFHYKFVYQNSSIKSTDEVEVFFSNNSILAAGKACIVIKDNSGDGNITFISKKKPKKDLTINYIKVKRSE